ncbi:MAG TPA: electron transport complex subunit RsxC [Patescibacteria group bacterium]|nr:electron transport complex subunit RsxC [Patescibacteria group bacterium]
MSRQALSFKGGVHPDSSKEMTQDIRIRKAEIPTIIEIPLVQHIGAPAQSLVKAGDLVKMGQKIGACSGYISANIHASVSGKVLVVEPRLQGSGMVPTVVIENDGKDELDPSITGHGDIEKLTSAEIIEIIKEAGIVGMGGATFPTHVKLNPPKEHKIDTLIINGAECEPYLTSDYRVMVEWPEYVVRGAKALIRALGIKKAYIGIEDNKPEAIKAIKNVSIKNANIEVVVLNTKYPQGGEKQLIKAITGREVPSGQLPSAIGCVVVNTGTASAIYKALKDGMPLIERVITVTGRGIKNPANLLVRLGTPLKEVIYQCGGLVDGCTKMICGGPMMGIAQYSTDISVTKGTSGILTLMEVDEGTRKEYPCIKCARCIDACPIGLMPLKVVQGVVNANLDEAVAANIMDCIECGCCTFICPAKRPLLQHIRVGKTKVRSRKS